MKRKFCLTVAMVTTVSLLLVNAQQTTEITSSGIGYLQYLPDGYPSGSKKFPVVIALHGIMEKGTASTNPGQVMKDLPRVARAGLPKYAAQGKNFPFILISPQLKNNFGSWPPSFVIEVLNHVKRKLQIDDKRIYLTGLSLGGYGVWKTAGEYPEIFAAIGPICPGGNALDKADALAAANVAAWGFHGDSDREVSYTVTTKMVSAMNTSPKKPNPLAKVTIFPEMGHNIWDKAYLETNLLDWMLSFRKGSGNAAESSSGASNAAPTADAGADKTLTLPTNSVTLQGKGADKDGRITAFHWEKVSGEDVVLDGNSTAALKVSALKEGDYAFRLTVKDDAGTSASDEVRVTVKAANNASPEVNAGPDKTLTLPDNAITLQGSASDREGEIASFTWTQLSGGTATLNGTSSPQLMINDLKEGAYTFRLTAKDNDGAQSSDDVRITVHPAAKNTPPVVNAGADRSLKLPENSLALGGSAKDEDGSVVALRWSQVSGPTAQLENIDQSAALISGLKEGAYVFRLTAEDNQGATSTDDVKVNVSHTWEASTQPAGYADTEKNRALPDAMPLLDGFWSGNN